jgi:hypothetical protein
MSAQECVQQWQALRELDNVPMNRSNISVDDPFDCSHLVSHEKQLIEQEVNRAIAKWRSLDERKVKKLSRGWSACKIRLPHNFDHLSRLDAPPNAAEQGERIVSLVNPNETESYETELWKIFKATRTIQELKRECGMKQTIQSKDNLDKTDPNRCRVSDRHGLPPADGPLVTSIFLEIWRKELRDNVSIDCNRMVLEFLGDQTLLDVHIAIQELTDDGLWTGGSSGVLLIEDTFYTTGEVDYVTPIRTWLREDPSRISYLGLAENLETKSMASVKLNQLQWSLNTRYLHMHHGHVESSFFLTDICSTRKHSLPYPIIHDIWAPSYPAVLCEGCQSRSAVLVTPATCKSTDGTAQICQSCHDSLFGDQESNAMDIHVFKQQHDLIPPL